MLLYLYRRLLWQYSRILSFRPRTTVLLIRKLSNESLTNIRPSRNKEVCLLNAASQISRQIFEYPEAHPDSLSLLIKLSVN